MARHIVSSDDVLNEWNSDDYDSTPHIFWTSTADVGYDSNFRQRDFHDDVIAPSICAENAIVTKAWADVVVEVSFIDPVEGAVHEQFIGSSWRSRQDDFDPQIGYDIAFWRAVRDAANKNLRRLNNHVEMLDTNRRHADARHRGED